MRITFSKNPSVLDPLIVNGKEIETVDNVKLLGVTMSSDLTWNAHIEEVIKKANKRLYFLVQLKRAKVPLKELVLFYTTCVRSVIDYAIPAFYHALPKYLKKELVRLEKRAIAIMNPGTHYDVASAVLNMRLIEDHHDLLCSRLFNSIMRDVNHKLQNCFHRCILHIMILGMNVNSMSLVLLLTGLEIHSYLRWLRKYNLRS